MTLNGKKAPLLRSFLFNLSKRISISASRKRIMWESGQFIREELEILLKFLKSPKPLGILKIKSLSGRPKVVVLRDLTRWVLKDVDTSV